MERSIKPWPVYNVKDGALKPLTHIIISTQTGLWTIQSMKPVHVVDAPGVQMVGMIHGRGASQLIRQNDGISATPMITVVCIQVWVVGLNYNRFYGLFCLNHDCI